MENELDKVHFQEFSIGYDNTIAEQPPVEIKKEALLMTTPKADPAKAMDDVMMVQVGQEGLTVPRFAL